MATPVTRTSRFRKLAALPAVALLGTLSGTLVLSGCSDPGAAAAGAQLATTAARNGVVYNTSRTSSGSARRRTRPRPRKSPG